MLFPNANFLEFHTWAHSSGKFILGCCTVWLWHWKNLEQAIVYYNSFYEQHFKVNLLDPRAPLSCKTLSFTTAATNTELSHSYMLWMNDSNQVCWWKRGVYNIQRLGLQKLFESSTFIYTIVSCSTTLCNILYFNK